MRQAIMVVNVDQKVALATELLNNYVVSKAKLVATAYDLRFYARFADARSVVELLLAAACLEAQNAQ